MEVAGNRLLTEHRQLSSEQSYCEPCQGEDVRTKAVGVCTQCKEYMCDMCFRHHLKAKLCRNHVLADISETTRLMLHIKDDDDVEKCKKHDNETIKFYCRTHESVGCSDCAILEHTNCKLEYIKDLARTDEKFKEMFEKLVMIESIKRKSEEKLIKNKREIDELNEKALNAIHQFRLDLNNYLDEAEANIRSDIKQLTSENIEQHKRLEQDIRLLMNEVEEVKRKLNRHHASKTVSFIHAVTCKPKMEDIETKYEQIKHQNVSKKFEYVRSEKLTELLKSSTSFGKLIIYSGNSTTSLASKMIINIRDKVCAHNVYRTLATETSLAAYEKEMKGKGMPGAVQSLNEKKDIWKNVELHIAVTGVPGAGKSSFINAIRGLKPSDPGAAEVGVAGTPQYLKSFKCPDNPRLIFWEMPSVNSLNFPRSDYKHKVNFYRYDIFVIVFKDRFTENDAWLAKQVQQYEKSVFYVRSKIDQDILNELRDIPDTTENVELRVTKVVRDEALCCLQKLDINDPQVFLICSYNTDRYDFEKLNEKLLALCKSLQKDRM